jgi:hypothetical protein
MFVFTTTGVSLDSAVFATVGYFPWRRAKICFNFTLHSWVGLHASVLDNSGDVNPATCAEQDGIGA